jgi:hypothetical protein
MQSTNLPLTGPEPYDPAKGITIVPVVIDSPEAWVDLDALHGNSRIEQGISFSDDPTIALEGRVVWIVWVGLRAALNGRDFYFSAVAISIRIDAPRGSGYRPSNYYTHMINAIQGESRLEGLSDTQLSQLADALEQHDSLAWSRRGRSLTTVWP